MRDLLSTLKESLKTMWGPREYVSSMKTARKK